MIGYNFMKNLILAATVVLASSFSFAYDRDKVEQLSTAAQISISGAEANLNLIPNLEAEIAILQSVSQSVNFGKLSIILQVEEKSQMRMTGIIELNGSIQKLENLIYDLNVKASLINRININVNRQEVENALAAALVQINEANNLLKLAVIEAENI
jgi:hypothetical protein